MPHHLQWSKLQIVEKLTAIQSDDDFDMIAAQIFNYQKTANPVYAEYLKLIGASNAQANYSFLPIELFKHHRVATETAEDVVFKSSGTTAQQRSSHHVFDASLYNELSKQSFELQYGRLSDWVVIALLPSYLENGDSSLVFMVDHFIRCTGNPMSAFVLNEQESLVQRLAELSAIKQKTLLIGVSYALVDFAAKHRIEFAELVVMETGGMKGRGVELTRAELHHTLKHGFPQSAIHSEYGMTELLSQAYSADGEWFRPSPWMRCVATDIADPFQILVAGKRGALAFIDLANYHSCSFIQTRDIGVVRADGAFTVEGRLDQSDLRGCNLLYT